MRHEVKSICDIDDPILVAYLKHQFGPKYFDACPADSYFKKAYESKPKKKLRPNLAVKK